MVFPFALAASSFLGGGQGGGDPLGTSESSSSQSGDISTGDKLFGPVSLGSGSSAGALALPPYTGIAIAAIAGVLLLAVVFRR